MKDNVTIVWKSSYINTTEFVAIEADKPYSINGHITGEVTGKPVHISYKLLIDSLWCVQSVLIDVQSDTSFTLSLKKNSKNQWTDETGNLLSEFNQCIDIDIS